MRPYSSGVYTNSEPFEQAVTSEMSLVTQFKNAGYKTMGMGKLWHGGLGFASQWTETGGKERASAAVKVDRSIGGIQFGVLEGGDEGFLTRKLRTMASPNWRSPTINLCF